VGGVLVHDQGDVLHVLGAEPARHDGFGCAWVKLMLYFMESIVVVLLCV
jgi:hypothetical protein